jgi:iron complex transport system substrate-binding protein
MRVVSFQPTATEFAFALGAGRSVVGVSHECAWPPAARRRPVVSRSAFDPEAMSAGQIDAEVGASDREGRSLYRIDVDLVERLRPDVLLTQSLCDVCAVSPGDLGEVARRVRPRPRTVTLTGRSLEGMFGDLGKTADALEADSRPLERALRRRLDAVARRTRGLPRRRVFVMEWLDPVFASGHWVPEMVELAGGRDGLAGRGKSRRIEWSSVLDYAPEILVLVPCGYRMERTRRELAGLEAREGWGSLPAVRSGQVWVADGPAYFNGAGPRLVDGVELLASIFHPEAFPGRRRGAVRARSALRGRSRKG